MDIAGKETVIPFGGHLIDSDTQESWAMHYICETERIYLGYYFDLDVGDGQTVRVCEEFLEPSEIGFTKMWPRWKHTMFIMSRKYIHRANKSNKFMGNVELLGRYGHTFIYENRKAKREYYDEFKNREVS